MGRWMPTTKDVSLLYQLFKNDQLTLASEFQRSAVWPTKAKAYLIDTILNEKSIPQLFFQRVVDSNTGRPKYEVIDGQQRLRSIFGFLEGEFSLIESKNSEFSNKKFDSLPTHLRERILNYDFVIQELHGYSERDITDTFIRINRFVVKLSPQELRHARYSGTFKEFVEKITSWNFWTSRKIFTPGQIRRMRHTEFTAELVILVIEGPQDKKQSIDLYYKQYSNSFSESRFVEKKIKQYVRYIERILPNLENTRFRKMADFYSLVGALKQLEVKGTRLSSLDVKLAGRLLTQMDQNLRKAPPPTHLNNYLIAASRQTDNIKPRTTRINTIINVLSKSKKVEK